MNVEPSFNMPRKEITKINPNLIEIIAPYRFPMEPWSGVDTSTLTTLIKSIQQLVGLIRCYNSKLRGNNV